MHPSAFSRLKLPAAQLANLESLGYLAMTPVQAEALPIALKGGDLVAQAKTGSGKTAAFAIPLLQRLDIKDQAAQALVLCPTRELCLQVSQELRKLARYLGNTKVVPLYGGQAMALQKEALGNGAHILVGTPGRIKDHLARENLSLGSVRTLVLDEADRMLDMGFLGDITEIISVTPPGRQTLMFSATFPEDIQVLSGRFQRNPVHIRIESEPGSPDIDQKFLICEKDGKLEGAASLLSRLKPKSAILFCNTKVAAKEAFQYLFDLGFGVAALHGDLEQRDREQILMRFRHGSCRVLVATDVAARGLDIEDLAAVINFEVPHDMETYVHRIGRTGRAGNTGYAITLALAGEQHKIAAAREFLGFEVPCETLEWADRDSLIPLTADQATLCISAGRKDKLRAGDILGALTGEKGLPGKAVGKIDVMDYEAYVSVERKSAQRAFARLSENKIKGKKYRVRILE
ncbi:MAG: ATP-dependent helicase DbpA [Fibrobacteres bacterium]|nr:ATP-dependent helicase DbpA [Fibrobacterota bacterium]